MQEFEKWTLDTIRSQGAGLSWLEEYRFEWTATIGIALASIVSGKTVVLITDHDRKWLETYILRFINKTSGSRPFICIVSIDQIYSYFDEISTSQALEMIEDMMSISLKNNYFFWYIGRGDDKRADIAKRQDGSLLWLFDEDSPNAFTMKSYDPQLDIKLLQLFRLFDISLNGVLFGEIDVQ